MNIAGKVILGVIAFFVGLWVLHIVLGILHIALIVAAVLGIGYAIYSIATYDRRALGGVSRSVRALMGRSK